MGIIMPKELTESTKKEKGHDSADIVTLLTVWLTPDNPVSLHHIFLHIIFTESTGETMLDVEKEMSRMGYRKVEPVGTFGVEGFVKHVAGRVVMVTQLTERIPPRTLKESVLVFYRDSVGGKQSEPVYWNSLANFLSGETNENGYLF